MEERMTREMVDVGGRRLSWLQSGQGDTVLLLHAFPLHAEMFAAQHASVPHGWRLVTPDFRGFGQSGGPAAKTVDDHADDVLALLRHLGIERAVIGGVSMGGYVAFALFRKAPQRFTALVLADTRADADNDEARTNRRRMQETAREKGVTAVADAMVAKLLGATSLASAELVARTRQLILPNSVDAVIDALDALRTRPDSTPLLASVACPTLVLVGEEDGVTPLPLADAIRNGIAGSTLTVVARAGHLANLEQPDTFNGALWSFLRTI